MAVSHLAMTLSIINVRKIKQLSEDGHIMHIIWDHTFGKQEDMDLVICRPMAKVDPSEEGFALDQGWLALDHPVRDEEVWYQSRSTRISLQEYTPRYRPIMHKGQEIKYKVIEANEMVKLLNLPIIYKKYMKRKGFKEDYSPFAHYHKRDQFMIFYIGTADNIVAFTKQKIYAEHEDLADLSPSSANHIEASGVESVLHANTVPIGSECLELELEWANENGVPYYYLGSGYEKSSEYKAKWSGFQWWTGVQWSRNKKQYRRLCRRDSRVKDFSALGKFSLIPDSP